MGLEKTSQPNDDDYAAVKRAMGLVFEVIRSNRSIEARVWTSALFSLVVKFYIDSKISFERFEVTVLSFVDACKKEWD